MRNNPTNDALVIQIDTPSIKKYVFGTDSLNEVRGASARLDWLNRYEMERVLRKHIPNVEKVYANGGTAQFLARECTETSAKAACQKMVRYLREQTGGEVRAVYGIARIQGDTSYRDAMRLAHFQLRCQREFGGGSHSASTMPAIMECQSASHLPAARRVDRGAESIEMLSVASHQKAREGRRARDRGTWAGWMQHLQDAGAWPKGGHWDHLRCEGITDIGERSSWRSYVGVVYADGNAMGSVVQALDGPETCRQFSRIVDESIREACFTGLGGILNEEVDDVRVKAAEQDDAFNPLPADILLLGGDDLLVAVPADRALEFALQVTGEFERLTREKIAGLQDGDVRRFFTDRLGDRGFTISCGVAIARSTHPFYLSLDLAGQLLKNAKRHDGRGAPSDADDPARIDFHVVAGANSHALERVRADTHRISTDAPRTLRPLACSDLVSLRAGVRQLRQSAFPRSKLHELRDAALTEEKNEAERRIRDILARSRHGSGHSQRRALWDAVGALCPGGHTFDFPWFRKKGRQLLCVADLVDAYDLFRANKGVRS